MYKVASDRRQISLHRGRPADWVNGEQNLSLFHQYEGLKLQDQQLMARINALPAGSEERRQLGKERQELCARMKAMKPSLHADKISNARGNVAECFVEIAKEMLPPGQFKAFYAAAKRRRDEHLERAQKIREQAEQMADATQTSAL